MPFRLARLAALAFVLVATGSVFVDAGEGTSLVWDEPRHDSRGLVRGTTIAWTNETTPQSEPRSAGPTSRSPEFVLTAGQQLDGEGFQPFAIAESPADDAAGLGDRDEAEYFPGTIATPPAVAGEPTLWGEIPAAALPQPAVDSTGQLGDAPFDPTLPPAFDPLADDFDGPDDFEGADLWPSLDDRTVQFPQRTLQTPQSEQPTIAELLHAERQFADSQSLETGTEGRSLDPGWWQPLVGQPLSPQCQAMPLSLDDAIVRGLEHSLQIRVFADLPLIRETAIVEADAAFDWQAFLDSRWDDTSDPVGNSLTAGAGIDRFRDHNANITGGVRRRTETGGQFEASQFFGVQENNSQFFVPNNQGTSRLTLSFTQPLLRGRGRAYNRTLVLLACLDKRVADDEFRRQLQTHLLEITRAYWALYFERGVLLQKMNTYRRAGETVARLEARKRLDASESQIRAARAALKARGSELIRARVAVANAADKLRSLINDPALGDGRRCELLPLDRPTFATFPADMTAALQQSLTHRPEVAQAIRQSRAAGMRLQMSRNELLPIFNVVTEAYVAGLSDDRAIGEAWGNQFSLGEPGYSIGLQMEVPVGNRAARTRHIRRCQELRQMQNQYALTLSTIDLEVRSAVREVNASQQELAAKQEAMAARVDQMNYIRQRWLRLSGEGTSAVLTLENLLLAQDRLAAAEFEYLQAQMTYNLSLMNLKRVTGSLLQSERVHIGTGSVNGLPTQFVGR